MTRYSYTSSDTQRKIDRHPDLWFPDGTVVIVADNTGFCVYAGILSRYSIMLKSMVSGFGEGLDEPEMPRYEGRPKLRLYDTPEDLALFLKVMHDASTYASLFGDSDISHNDYFKKIVTLIRLSTQYEASSIRDKSIEKMSLLYPTKLSDWDRGQSRLIDLIQFNNSPLHPFAIVQLARDCDLKKILPVALFASCALTSMNEILDGAPQVGSCDNVELSYEDKRRCILARRSLDSIVQSDLLQYMWYGGIRQPPLLRWNGICNKNTCSWATIGPIVRELTMDGKEGF
ncbi:hypothetical protein C8Q75DRAFT_808767 [Abortiporus biennis]|nr:hypothetical protein C8Q75DRAFT_808767 [Abortiporus biennis]